MIEIQVLAALGRAQGTINPGLGMSKQFVYGENVNRHQTRTVGNHDLVADEGDFEFEGWIGY